MVLTNICTPNRDGPAFFGMLECKIGEAESGHDRPVIVVGDFNQVTDSVLDSSSPSKTKKQGCRYFE